MEFFTIFFAIIRKSYFIFNKFEVKNSKKKALFKTVYALMMATAFIGYVLSWGQMSFWGGGATVTTRVFLCSNGISGS